jgi:hypothetical protein
MQVNDEVPELPTYKDGEINYAESFDQTVKELEKSPTILLFYENEKGELKLKFTGLDAPLYACLVVHLSQLENHKPFEFLKLALEGALQMKKCNKKGYEMTTRIEQYIKKA